MLASMAAATAGSVLPIRLPAPPELRIPLERPIRTATGAVDWTAVRELFPLRKDWTHLAAFLFVSHPKPVAESIDYFRRKLDSDHYWLEAAAFSEAEGKPFTKIRQSLAEYTGGKPNELALTQNTTTALAIAYHGLRIRRDQEILSTTHDHFSHHKSIDYACERSGAKARRIALYDNPATANATQMVGRIARNIRPSTRAVGVTWVHSSTGVKVPVAAIAEAVARANRGRASADRCLLIVDGVHGFANVDVDIATLGADFFAAGAHKWLFAPRGTGFLWGRSDAWTHLRPTIPTFDPDGLDNTWGPWMQQTAEPPTQAPMVSPGGFIAYEHLLALPAAVDLHKTIGRANIASRVMELNSAFRAGAAKLRNVTLHTPTDPEMSGGLTCFDVAGLTAEQVSAKLAEQKIRTNNSPYRVSYARVSAGVMNTPEEIDLALRAIRELH